MLDNKNKQSHHQTVGEEIANSITHGIGTLLSIAGLVILIVFAALYGNAWHVVSFSIFGSTLIILYLASTLYHSFPKLSAKNILKRLDHSAIFILIAGSYTPFMLTNIRGAWGWSLFGVIWALAITGVVFKSIFIFRFQKLSVLIYIFMGWLCLVAFKEIVIHVPPFSLLLLIIGGVSYTIGTIFYAWRKLPYNHTVWHIFVLCGSLFHYFSVLYSI